jgi:hypothetical protein
LHPGAVQLCSCAKLSPLADRLKSVSSAVVILVALLIFYTIASAIFAFNVWNVSNRVAGWYVGKSWWIRGIVRDNPNSYKAGGAIGLASGVLLLGWIALQATR